MGQQSRRASRVQTGIPACASDWVPTAQPCRPTERAVVLRAHQPCCRRAGAARGYRRFSNGDLADCQIRPRTDTSRPSETPARTGAQGLTSRHVERERWRSSATVVVLARLWSSFPLRLKTWLATHRLLGAVEECMECCKARRRVRLITVDVFGAGRFLRICC